MTDYMSEWKTLTGMTLREGLQKMVDILPPDAYTAVPGGSDLTDINPAYLTQVATDVFGLCGVGWNFDYSPDTVVVSSETRQKKAGGDREVHIATITKLVLYFTYVDNEGAIRQSLPVVSNGSSENDNEGYALRGALTNAIGAAFAKLCWQLLVYQGKINHHNAKALWDKKSGKVQDREPEAGKAKPVEAKQQAPAKPEAPEKEPKPEQVIETTTQSAPAISIDTALSMVIPEGIGVPMAGKTLGVAKNSPNLGKPILNYLAGAEPKKDNTMFTPANEIQQQLQEAAKLILSTM